jgi:glucose-6-phosphate isomerase
MENDLVKAQSGAITAIADVLAALIETHPDPKAFFAALHRKTEATTAEGLAVWHSEQALDGHRKFVDRLFQLIQTSSGT